MPRRLAYCMVGGQGNATPSTLACARAMAIISAKQRTATTRAGMQPCLACACAMCNCNLAVLIARTLLQFLNCIFQLQGHNSQLQSPNSQL